MVKNVRVELLFHVPNMACYRYTTLSIYDKELSNLIPLSSPKYVSGLTLVSTFRFVLRLLQTARAYPTHSVFFGTKVANRTSFFAYLVRSEGLEPPTAWL